MLFKLPSTGGFHRKPYSSLVLKIHTKICETRKHESIHGQHFEERKIEGRKPDTKFKPWKTRVYAQKPPTKNGVQEFHPVFHLNSQ